MTRVDLYRRFNNRNGNYLRDIDLEINDDYMINEILKNGTITEIKVLFDLVDCDKIKEIWEKPLKMDLH
jgi:hypothetical protein